MPAGTGAQEQATQGVWSAAAQGRAKPVGTTNGEMAVPMAEVKETGVATGKGHGIACGGVATVTKRAVNPSGQGVGGGTACGTYELGHGTAKGEGVGNGKG